MNYKEFCEAVREAGGKPPSHAVYKRLSNIDQAAEWEAVYTQRNAALTPNQLVMPRASERVMRAAWTFHLGEIGIPPEEYALDMPPPVTRGQIDLFGRFGPEGWRNWVEVNRRLGFGLKQWAELGVKFTAKPGPKNWAAMVPEAFSATGGTAERVTYQDPRRIDFIGAVVYEKATEKQQAAAAARVENARETAKCTRADGCGPGKTVGPPPDPPGYGDSFGTKRRPSGGSGSSSKPAKPGKKTGTKKTGTKKTATKKTPARKKRKPVGKATSYSATGDRWRLKVSAQRMGDA